MSESASEDRGTSRVVAAVLHAAGRLDALSRGVTIAALIGFPAAGLAGAPRAVAWLLVAAVLAGLAELWFAARVALDAALFADQARAGDPADWHALDTGLIRLGLMPAAKAGRPAAPRIAGALRLAKVQAACLAAQILLVLAGGAACQRF